MKFRLTVGAALGVIAAATMAFAQEAPQTPAKDEAKAEKPKWDVANPPLPTRTVKINVDEGTWMDIDVSPDGKLIAFDLLGDIYLIGKLNYKEVWSSTNSNEKADRTKITSS